MYLEVDVDIFGEGVSIHVSRQVELERVRHDAPHDRHQVALRVRRLPLCTAQNVHVAGSVLHACSVSCGMIKTLFQREEEEKKTKRKDKCCSVADW